MSQAGDATRGITRLGPELPTACTRTPWQHPMGDRLEPARPRVARSLAGRIDRLARRAHVFHRFAHHPLCDAYAGEVISIGRGRLCRGCAYVGLGGVTGLSVAALAPVTRVTAWAALGFAAALLGASLAVRLPKWLGRFTPALLGGLAPAGGAVPTLTASLAAVVLLAAYRRRGPARGPCVDCPERGMSVCSGFAAAVQRERAFQRLAGRWLRSARAVGR
jgi:hypothetical protein